MSSRSARDLRLFLSVAPHPANPAGCPLNVWSHKKRVEKLQYMHMNPVKRGLVLHPQNWPWSSFSFYAKREVGLVPIDPVQ